MSELTIADDLLGGAGHIAGYIGKSVRQTNYLLERGLLPAFKWGGIWHMRKSAFVAFVERMEAGSARPAGQLLEPSIKPASDKAVNGDAAEAALRADR